MNKKLIFRILGALASALIIISVFVPFVSVTGYKTSLWESFELTNSLYLPIMIIVFGAIGVIFFALNIKTEFAYMSTGAITFFLIVETVDILNQGVFNTLNVGYYFLAIGAILTGVMAFLTNLKSNKKEEKVIPIEQKEETSMLDKIDKLYDEQTVAQSEISPIQPVDNAVEPLPIQPLETVVPLPSNPVIEEQPVKEDSLTVVEPIIEKQLVGDQPVQAPVEQPINPVLQEFAKPINPTVQEFSNQTPVNPVVQEFSQPVNPVVQEFSIPQENIQPVEQNIQPISEEQSVSVPEQNIPLSDVNQPVNPVVQEFTNPGSSVISQQNSNAQDVDIFGQPINR